MKHSKKPIIKSLCCTAFMVGCIGIVGAQQVSPPPTAYYRMDVLNALTPAGQESPESITNNPAKAAVHDLGAGSAALNNTATGFYGRVGGAINLIGGNGATTGGRTLKAPIFFPGVTPGGPDVALDTVTAFTLSGWIRPNTDISVYSGIFTSNSAGNPGYFGFNVNQSRVADFRFAGSSINSLTAPQIRAETWYHFAMTWTTSGGASTNKAYINGVLIGTQSAAIARFQPADTTSVNWSIGTDRANTGRKFNGLMDDFAVFNVALSDADITLLFNNGRIGLPVVFAAGDSDGDGVPDASEPTSANNPDRDGDGLNDGLEGTLMTNPDNPDTDGDGMPDGWEIDGRLLPQDPGTATPASGPAGDVDSDNLTNLEEYQGNGLPEIGAGPVGTNFTNPRLADSDSDLLTDGDERKLSVGGNLHRTNPNDVDSDDDTIRDNIELTFGLDPNIADNLSSDIDGDTLTLGTEINPASPRVPTNPNLADTDGDTLNDDVEFTGPLLGDPAVADVTQRTNPTRSDTDFDGIRDEDELSASIGSAFLTNPARGDTDLDFYTDSVELAVGTSPISASEKPTEDSAGPKPVAYWSMDEVAGTVARESVNTTGPQNGTWRNNASSAALTWVPGQLGNAGNQNAGDTNNNSFVLPRITGLGGSASITICAWVKQPSTTTPYRGIFMTRSENNDINTNTAINWGFAINNAGSPTANRLDIRGNNGGILSVMNSAAMPPVTEAQATIDTNWRHVAMVFTRDTSVVPATSNIQKGYIDGIEVVSSTVAGNQVSLNGNGWLLGSDPNGDPERNFNGSIDDVAVFAQPLTAAQILAIYNAGIATPPARRSIRALYGLPNPVTPAAPIVNTPGSAVTFNGTTAAFTFNSDPGRPYRLQYSTDLVNFTNLPTMPNVTGTNPGTSTTVNIDVSALVPGTFPTLPPKIFFRAALDFAE